MSDNFLYYSHFFDDAEKILHAFSLVDKNIYVDIIHDNAALLESISTGRFSLVFVEDEESEKGTDIIKTIHEISPDLPVICIINPHSKNRTHQLLSLGAIDVITMEEFFSSHLKNVCFKAIKKGEMIKREKKLKSIILRTNKFWLSVFDNTPDLIFVISEEGNILRCNKAFANVFDKHPRDIIGKNAIDDFELNFLQDTFLKKHCSNSELEFRGKIYNLTCATFYFDDLPNIVIIMRDITELKKIREHLFLKDKYTSIGTLASGIAHEINNPLTGIIGFTQMLKMMDECKTQIDVLDKILECADRCKKIVESMLIYSRQRPATKSLELINNIIERTIDLVGYTLKKNNININKNLKNIPITLIDNQQIQQALINIIINAQEAIILANRTKGLIEIETEYDEINKKVYIKISDNGTGIDEKIINKIYDPFFTTKPFGESMGLGLSIAYGIIKEHGGNINVESKPNVGTTFVIELPVEF